MRSQAQVAIASTAAVVLAGTLLAFSSLQRFADADSLIPVFVSTLHWTPFYWGQARFGMLVPLMAMPVANPLANLLLQDSINAVFSISAFFALARYLCPRPTWPIAGAIAALLALVGLPDHLVFQLSTQQPYGVSMALGTLGLICLEHQRGASNFEDLAAVLAGVALTALAVWVNTAVSATLIPIVLVRHALVTRPREGTAVALQRAASECALLLAIAGGLAVAASGLHDPNPYFGIGFASSPIILHAGTTKHGKACSFS